MIAHRLLGAGHQTVVAELAPGQTLWCGPHRLLWATPNVTVRLRPPAPGPDGVDGVLDRAVATAVAAGRRRLAGAPAGLPHLRAVGGSGLAALAGPDGGEVRAVELAGRAWLVHWDGLVAAEVTVGLDGPAPDWPEAAGPPPQRLAGAGTLLLAGAGGLAEVDPAGFGGEVRVDADRLVALQEGVRAAPTAGLTQALAVALGGAPGRLVSLRGAGTVLLRVAARPRALQERRREA